MTEPLVPPANEPASAVVIRWIARILSILSIGVLLLFFIGEADLSQSVRLTVYEWIGLLFFSAGVVAGMVIGWRREGVGSGVTVGSLVAFYLIDLIKSEDFPGGPFFLLFASPGILFGVSWMLCRKAQSAG